jgi:GTP pyrophosphokinase
MAGAAKEGHMSKRVIEGLSHRFSEALVGAARLHATQPRKGSDIPYIAHLLGVTGIALEFGATEDEAIAAVLHDVIEDIPPSLGSDWARRWIRFQFGEAALEIVEGCTDTDTQPKPPWRRRKVTYIEHLASASKSVVLVSASDKLHNARAILRDYRRLAEEVWTRFDPEAGKEGTVGYYRGLAHAFRDTGYHAELIGELDAVVTEIETVTQVQGVWPPPL